MKRFSKWFALMAGMLISLGGWAQGKVNIFVATGPTTGVYYPLGGGLADVLTKFIPNLNATAGTTDGSMANLLLINQGKADIAFSMADASWDAYKGQQKFQDKPVNVRALMVLYPNRMHIVTVEGTGINKVSDLKGKRVSTGAPNSATQIMAYRVLEAYGIDPEKDIIRERLDPGKSSDAIKDKKLDAYFWVGGIPTPAVTDLGATPGLKLKLIDHADATEAMVKKYGPLYVKDVIPAKSYPGQDTPNQIATVWNVLVADAKLSDQLAYDIVKTIFEHKQDLIRVHAEAKSFEYKYQTNGAAVIPYHPGAKKYFAEKGVKLN
ncbi:MAG TPA: TAXI family TRAP transporter solute-binding subunit [Burkholderiales bacterium]|nr:TAXI family TRAP transporter solute-binding subunit [Burkholderiales bacterium]